MKAPTSGIIALPAAILTWARSTATMSRRGLDEDRVEQASPQHHRLRERRSGRPGRDTVTTLRRLGSAASALALVCLLTSAPPAGATFPGRNGLIVFDTHDRPSVDGGSSQIYTVRPDGSGLRQLTHLGSGHNAFDPHWSPDGRRIAYISDVAGSADVWVMFSNGTSSHQLLSDPGYDHSSPSWSPDGQRLVLSRCSQFLRTCALAVVRRDGTGLRVIVGGNWNFSEPAWSPDGRWLAYTSDKGGYDSRLWVARADGRAPRTIAPAPLAAGRPAWSPDSRQITFTGDSVNGQLFAIHRDGTGLRAVTQGESIFGTWSPDYRRMVLLSFRSGAPALVVATSDARAQTTIVTLPGIQLSDWAVAR